MAIELRREGVEVFQRAGGLAGERTELLLERRGGFAVAAGDVVHRRDELRNSRDERALQRVEVVVGAGEHFLQQDVAFTQPLEQGERVGAQDFRGFPQLVDGRGRNLTRLVDGRARGLVDVLQRLADGADRDFAGGVDLAGQIRRVVHHRDGECAAMVLDRLERGVRSIADGRRNFGGLAGDGVDQRAALAVHKLGELFGVLTHAAGDRFHLAVER